MKYLKWIVLAVVVLVVVVIGAVWLNLNGIVRRTVQAQASSSLDLQTTVGGANVSLIGGNVRLNDLQVASPDGFQSPRMFTLGSIFVDTSFGELRSDPIRVSQIQIDKPTLVIEQSGGKFNFQVLTEKQSKAPPPDSGEPIRLIINQLAVNDAQVVLRPGIPGLAQEINLTIPSFALREIGTGEGANNGAAIKEVVSLLVTTLAQKASESDKLPEDVRRLLSLDVEKVKQQLATQLGKQLDRISNELGTKLPPQLKNDATKAVEKGIGELLGGQKKPATQKSQ
ncbi:hypothetical protein [Fontivita pretiosa]|jgi:uncharacterized protein involved in outer membrane biogenesis|uniref:DUF748 domain-containing protein n=1 Tax=Fontivita pretiosa TaxID=2989684 RepID=UPI003D170196